nr:MAG TPA: hypothetical protein [Caudoviricetes sp.]
MFVNCEQKNTEAPNIVQIVYHAQFIQIVSVKYAYQSI